jgi:hypothetical protein
VTRSHPTGFPIQLIHFLLVAHSPLVTTHRPSCPASMSNTTVPHPNCSIRVWTPRTLCTSCTSCLEEQPVLYRFTSLHCMSPSSVQRVHTSVCAHAPFMPFLSKLAVKAADLRSQRSLSVFHLTTSPWSLLHVIHLSTIDTTRMQSLCTIFLVPMPSLYSVTLLPRLPLPFGLSVSYPPFYPMPQHTHVLYLHTAYRT